MLKTASKLVSTDQLITPISLAGDVTLSTGNLVIGTAGKGIDFSADPNAGGMTSELLDDYEEGTWSPVITSASGTVTLVDGSSCTYTKVGRFVYIFAVVGITTDASVGTTDLTIAGLPFTVAAPSFGNFTFSNFSSTDFGVGGAHGLVFVSGTSLSHVARSINISSRTSTFFWGYAAVYAV